MMTARVWSLVSTLAMVPAMRALLHNGSTLGLVYLASFCVTVLYHANLESRFRVMDHVLAYGVIAANTWMVWATHNRRYALLGCVFVLLSLMAYVHARQNPEQYDRSHALWHVLSGIAGFLFVLGYV